MDFYEPTIETKEIFSGRILNLRVDTIALPDGKTSLREIVDHKDAVAILPIVDDCMVFVKQFRKAIETVLTEIPAGLMEVGENIFETASRELQEEIGLKPMDLKYLGDMWPSPGFTNEKTALFMATQFEEEALEADDDEFIQIIRIPIPTVRALYLSGKFTDAKTACALGRYFSQCR
ncbi:NUDIX hydrolase [Eubacterium barkeri]|uniref:ADP-ribose pyrophosphatase n=1 Tax=Eubacterium barkeri TaxID=1528 RepID=A0A1H3EE47_EUBBA|nr:NUDIX hydrolase [Eubacterium barkeri]SDX76981.1 ADP-ribose pyrophosphatase [Eubacterium barkeri]